MQAKITVGDSNNIRVAVTPVSQTVISIPRGFAGPPGPNAIGGYSINITDIANYDALMFLEDEWVNIPQTEITDGGNF